MSDAIVKIPTTTRNQTSCACLAQTYLVSACYVDGRAGERSNVIRIELCNLFHGLEGRKEVCRLHDIGVSKGGSGQACAKVGFW